MGQLISAEVITSQYSENFSWLITNKREGTTDIIIAVSNALLEDIFVRIIKMTLKGL